MLVALVILGNSVVVGVEVQYAAQNLTSDLPKIFMIFQYSSSIFFLCELLLRCAAMGTWEFFVTANERAWNWFDFTIVSFAILQFVIERYAGNSLSLLLQFARIFRVLRVFRIIRFMPFVGLELKYMMYSIFDTMKSLLCSLILIFLIMYFFGVAFTQASTYHLIEVGTSTSYAADLRAYWGSIDESIITLFMSMTGGISWVEPVRALRRCDTTVAIYFSMFLFFISFTLFAYLNVITGFFVDNAFDLASHDKEQAVQEQLRTKAKWMTEFKDFFKSIDTDNSGDLTIKELEEHIQNDTIQSYFAHMKLDVDKAWDIFRLLDDDMSGAVSVEEFVNGCLKLRGPAKATDVAGVMYEIKKLDRKLSAFSYDVRMALRGETARPSCSPTEIDTSPSMARLTVASMMRPDRSSVRSVATETPPS